MCTRAWGGGVGSGAGKAIGPPALPILLTEKRRGKNRNNFMGFIYSASRNHTHIYPQGSTSADQGARIM